MKKALALALALTLLLGCSVAYATQTLFTGYIEATGDVNVRTGPGLAYSTQGSIKKGETLPYLGEISTDNRGVNWYKVSYQNAYGWVSSVYSALHTDSVPIIPMPTASAQPAVYVRATASVNLRSGAGLKYEDIGTLTKGEQVLYLDNSAKDARGVTWYEVQYYSYGTGWVSSTYSELVYGTEAGVADGLVNVTGTYVEATGGKSNLRSGAGLDYKDLGTIQKGERATYLGSYSTDERGVVWYYVRYDGVTGWVSSRYTTLY